ncbi:hypothetical protein DICPUDRAFT_94413 [Dictyostelium purpureum]|uniref:VPS9 domain-containing protein n=1 Tax=Dictyostelium purpureum TaxID=5786 RepID=F0ZJ85_DICPU|nr:uncharacterized protein DICPUDRAFT_94413 [Dictyostelium purpureum]EGC35977.1 hypothetical protein DICPUDRAFT_94413 [Dictyostelium purpureum]|eukprot:XP_003287478.1 hypothetical protein DICPUDRAFT_94413 [Dictyostelium purpureum]
MTAYKSPREKLMCIKKSFKLLFQLLSKTSEIIGADLLLPIVIYCLIKSNLPFLILNLQFISLFRDPTLIESETSYFLVTMFTATSFIENMTFESLTDARDPSLSEDDKVKDNDEHLVSAKDGEIKISEKNNGNVNNIQQHEAIKLNIEKENFVNENDKSKTTFVPQSTISSTTDEEKRKLYRFYHSKPEDISIREIKQLLGEYNELVDKLFSTEKK